MAIVDEIRIKQRWSPEGYTFENLTDMVEIDGTLLFEEPPLGYPVFFENVPLHFFGNKIPALHAEWDGWRRAEFPISSADPLTERLHSVSGARSYFGSFGIVLPPEAVRWKACFYFDGFLVRVGPRGSSPTTAWLLMGSMIKIDCTEWRL